MQLPHLTPLGWVAVVLAAGLVGFAKTGIGGASTIAVAVFAALLPARESTGTLLPLLIMGDLAALARYRSHADRALLVRLVPWVAVGVLVGTGFVAVADNGVMRRTIGALLLALLLLQVVQYRRPVAAVAPVEAPVGARWRAASAGTGIAAGFCTMVANAAGAVMALYLLALRVPKLAFLGTGAWFFFLLNVFKLPFSAALGVLTPRGLLLDAVLAPAVLAGTWVGAAAAARLAQRQFEGATLALSAVSAVALLR